MASSPWFPGSVSGQEDYPGTLNWVKGEGTFYNILGVDFGVYESVPETCLPLYL